ncbi:MAG: hypothetical protein IPL83_03990 [Bdellovibrionales bacterium]|nr:hypothetical protein [Bdellovibrionales bacterium]
MNNNISSSVLFLLIAASIGTFGASLFWTGFPVYYASITNTSWSLSGVYTLATLGTLLFTLIGGVWGDTGNYGKLAVRSHFVSFIFILTIFGFTFGETKRYLLFVLPLLYFNFSLGFISESVWLLKSTETIDFQKRILDRTMLTLISKLLGFSLGPLLFLTIGRNSLLICGGAFLMTSIIQLILILKTSPVISVKVTNSEKAFKLSLKNMASLFSSPVFVLAAFLTGMLSIPFNPLFVLHLEKIGTPKDISLFWLVAGLSGFSATVIMRKTKILDSKKWFLGITFGMCMLLYNAFSSIHPVIVIGFASLYVFLSIQFSAKTHIITAVLSKSETVGSSVGSVNFLMDLGVFLGMFLGTFASTVPLHWITYISTGLLLARWVAFSKLLKLSEM